MKKQLVTTIAAISFLGLTGNAFATTNEDYATELNSLKQRMAELESKVQKQAAKKEAPKKEEMDKLRVNGDFRIRSVWNGGPAGFDQRVRLALTDRVNDNTTFYVRWAVMNNSQMGTTARGNDNIPSNSKDPDLSAQDRNIVSDAYMKVNHLFGSNTSVTMGRFGQDIGATGFWNSEGNIGLIDGIKIDTQIDKLRAIVGYANWSPLHTLKAVTTTPRQERPLANAAFVNASYKISEGTSLYWTYVKEMPSNASSQDFQVTGPGIRTVFDNNWSFRGDYLRNYAAPGNPVGDLFSLRYKGADDQKPHSYGLTLDYHYVQPNNIAYTLATANSMQPAKDIKGPGVSAHYAVAQNCLLDFYQTFNTKKASTGEKVANYSRLQMVYGF